MNKTDIFYTILDLVCAYYNVDEEQLLSRSRAAQLVEPRQVLHYLSRTLGSYSLAYIGKKTNRDHATVINSFKKIEGKIAPLANGSVIDPKLRDIVVSIKKAVESSYQSVEISDVEQYLSVAQIHRKNYLREKNPNITFVVDTNLNYVQRLKEDRANPFVELQSKKELLKDVEAMHSKIDEKKRQIENEIKILELKKNEIYA